MTIRHYEKKLNAAITRHERRAVAAARADLPHIREAERNQAVFLEELRDMLNSGSEARMRQARRVIDQMVTL